MHKHTPGPWKAEKFCVWGGDKYVAATQTGILEEEQQANAALIAAAPELLENLKRCVDSLEHWFWRYGDPEGANSQMMKNARAAIAKAEVKP